MQLIIFLEKNKNNFLTIDDLFKLIQGTECIIIPHGCKNPHGLKSKQDDEINIEDAIDLVNIITSSSSINVLFEHTKPHFGESFKTNLIEKAKLSDSAKRLTPEIKELRNDIKSLEYIKDHSQRCIDYNKELERKKKLERRNIN